MNLTNKHSRKHEGFVNEKAIGIQADDNTVRLFTSNIPFENFEVLVLIVFLQTGPNENQNRNQVPPTRHIHAPILLLRLRAQQESVQERRQLHGEEGLPKRFEGRCGGESERDQVEPAGQEGSAACEAQRCEGQEGERGGCFVVFL